MKKIVIISFLILISKIIVSQNFSFTIINSLNVKPLQNVNVKLISQNTIVVDEQVTNNEGVVYFQKNCDGIFFVNISLSGYVPVLREIKLPLKSKSKSFTFSLEPCKYSNIILKIFDTKTLQPVSNVLVTLSGVKVYTYNNADNQEIKISNIEEGKYNLNVVADGYIPLDTNLFISNSISDIYQIYLLPVTYNNLIINVLDYSQKPISDANVSVSNIVDYKDVTDNNGTVSLKNLKSDNYKVAITANGYANGFYEINLRNDTSLTYYLSTDYNILSIETINADNQNQNDIKIEMTSVIDVAGIIKSKPIIN